MKLILTTVAALSLASASVFAGCGKIEVTEGKLKSFDAESKKAVVEAEGKDVTLTLTPSSKGGDKLEKKVGKKVKISSSHNKITEVD